jgi:hypothetical protein
MVAAYGVAAIVAQTHAVVIDGRQPLCLASLDESSAPTAVGTSHPAPKLSR